MILNPHQMEISSLDYKTQTGQLATVSNSWKGERSQTPSPSLPPSPPRQSSWPVLALQCTTAWPGGLRGKGIWALCPYSSPGQAAACHKAGAAVGKETPDSFPCGPPGWAALPASLGNLGEKGSGFCVPVASLTGLQGWGSSQLDVRRWWGWAQVVPLPLVSDSGEGRVSLVHGQSKQALLEARVQPCTLPPGMAVIMH